MRRNAAPQAMTTQHKRKPGASKYAKDFLHNKYLYLLMLPIIAYYVVFHYMPMYGAIIAFKNFSPVKGIWGSEWAGMEHFQAFFSSYYFWRLLTNTLLLSLNTLLFEFPAPILLALLLNEVRNRRFKNMVQTIAYMPYFISLVVICGIVKDFTGSGGFVNLAYTFVTGTDGQALLQKPELFRSIYVLSEIWQKIGWESIIYMAALTGIDQEQYEAARIDGASRLRQMWHITLPGLMPTIMIMLILRIGNMLNVGYEKIILLYNPVIYETADVISTSVYRKGLLEANWGFSSAVGLFNSAFNLLLLVGANYLSRKWSKNSLW
jgi:putative aldouronate transport system permease protein